jgi:hypothetical protein
MAQPVICPECAFPLRPAAEYWSGGVRYWSLPSQDRQHFEATCLHPGKGLGDGIVWCPALRLANGAAQPAPHARDILTRFQSLGDNCEFGLVQRLAGAEPLDLLRFASFYRPDQTALRQTIDALAAGFEGLGDPAAVACELTGDRPPRQFAVRETRWQLLIHPERTEAEITAEALHAQQTRILPFRRRKLLEDLAAAHRIFVWKSNTAPPEAEIR